ncbi:MAG: hypothetical protein ACSLE9_21615 [Burkholderiaceae bacterium]
MALLAAEGLDAEIDAHPAARRAGEAAFIDHPREHPHRMQTVHDQPQLCFYLSNTKLNSILFIDSSAMSTVHRIDEQELTELGQDGTRAQSPPCPKHQNPGQKGPS